MKKANREKRKGLEIRKRRYKDARSIFGGFGGALALVFVVVMSVLILFAKLVKAFIGWVR